MAGGEGNGEEKRKTGMKSIKNFLLAIFVIFIIYILIIGWPEKTHKGANLACHGIWISSKNCFGFTTTWMYLD